MASGRPAESTPTRHPLGPFRAGWRDGSCVLPYTGSGPLAGQQRAHRRATPKAPFEQGGATAAACWALLSHGRPAASTPTSHPLGPFRAGWRDSSCCVLAADSSSGALREQAAQRQAGGKQARAGVGAEHTSVPIIFFAKALISFTARGARFLKPMPCSSFRRWTVYSRVTTSVAAVAFFLSPFALHVDGSEGSARERDGARNRRQDRVGSLASHRATTQGTQ